MEDRDDEAVSLKAEREARRPRGEHEQCVLPRPEFDPEAEPEQLAGGDDHSPAEDPPEIRAAEKPTNLNDLAPSEGNIALVYKCGRCGKIGFVPDHGAVMAAERGVGVGIKCGICKGDIVVETKAAKRAREQRIQVADLHQLPRNRAGRRMHEAFMRKLKGPPR